MKKNEAIIRALSGVLYDLGVIIEIYGNRDPAGEALKNLYTRIQAQVEHYQQEKSNA